MTEPEPPVTVATIRIWRLRSKKRDRMAAWRVMIDGREYGRIKNGQQAAFAVPPGAHELKLKTAPWCSSPAQSVYVGPGQTAEFSAEPGGGVLDACFSMWLRPGSYILLEPIKDFSTQFGDRRRWPEDAGE